MLPVHWRQPAAAGFGALAEIGSASRRQSVNRTRNQAVAGRSEQGRLAEEQALGFLEQAGLKLLDRNYHSRYGEIDLIMEEGRTVVFVEVRYRRSDRYGSAQESVNRAKQAKLILTAACFLREKRLDRPARFDVAALAPGPDGFSVAWVKGAFEAE